MGPIAAALLLLTDKITAFELCVRLFDQITPDYHSATMEGLQTDIQVLMVLMKSTFKLGTVVTSQLPYPSYMHISKNYGWTS